ncbi:MAG: long-chain acyl-CoA synthetase [Clostridia bacterium]|nr:long-chain acyl-CoA synthetase [Clostridia bacterium]
MSVASLLRKTAAEFSDKTAIYFQDIEITYKDLEEKVNRLANGLANLGLKKGERAAVLLPNCPEFVISYFGIVSIGATIVPINPLFKGEELKYILNDASIKILITAAPFQNLVESIWNEAQSLESLIIIGGETENGLTP